ncbi:COG4223 family protein [Cognatishimia sp.]|uniref:COG4223 family protein n=1 Tax=Cognatishimia sp. TaxID=2211648 RepID=UPI0035165CB3|nr:hypothetical protein [Cognatishimia sp.]
MAKAKKSDTSDDQDKTPATEVKDDVVEAEVLEEIPADAEDAPEAVEADSDESSDESDEAAQEDPASEEVEAFDEGAEEEAPLEPEVDTTPTPAPEPARSGAGFVPLLIGGVLAGGIGFGAAQVLGPLQSGPDETTLALQAEVQAQAASIQELQASSDKSQGAADQAASDTASLQGSIDGLTASLAAINGQFDDVSNALAGLDARIIELEKRPLTQGLPSSAIEAYERELEELKASVASQRAEAQAMEENAKMTAQQALARAALTRVLSALDAGQSFRAPLTDLVTATGSAAPVELEALADTGAPSLASLQASYPDAARAALAAARQTEGQTGNRFLSFMQSQLGARSVTPQEGDDADAILSRAEAALTSGNLTDTLAEIAALPEAAQAEIADWAAAARTRQEALAAGEALSQELNTN